MNNILVDFGTALKAVKEGKRISRIGWNGKGMWLILVKENEAFSKNENVVEFTHLPWIGMKTADNKFVPWLASQSDMLAEDWVVIEL